MAEGHSLRSPFGSEGTEAVQLLSEAVSAYREALKVHTREQLISNCFSTLRDKAIFRGSADAR